MKRRVGKIWALLLAGATSLCADERPHVLWLTLEDTSPHFIGCYGNEAAKTPHIDSLAARGIRLTAAFANAPVCSAARSTIITGALNETIGTGNHRSNFPLPDKIQGFPTFLKQAGYYTSNHVKTDYNTSSASRLIRECWHESSTAAGWWKREKGQPFFSVFNFDDCHQSRTMTYSYDWYRSNVLAKLPPEAVVAEDSFAMPPFLPDTPAYRRDVARVYNSISLVDTQIGSLLARLAAEGLTDDTIIFCYADHGEAIPRGKTNPIGLGYQVPFIIVFPPKWEHLNPWGAAGTTSHELINFDDLAPTLLSLIGMEKKEWMTGRPFLGPLREDPPEFTYASRNRIDESEGCSRSITDGHYLYSRHFLPGPEAKWMKYSDVADISLRLRQDLAAGELSAAQSAMFAPQPHEVLYDLRSDPWEMSNLATDPAHSERLSFLRGQLFEHIITVSDIMLRPEYELARISQQSTPYDYGQELATETKRAILAAADLASRPEPDPSLLRKLLASEDATISYWAATAFRQHSHLDRSGLELAEISSYTARIEIAAALYRYDHNRQAFQVLARNARGSIPQLRLQALQRIQELGPKAADFETILKEVAQAKQSDPHSRNSAQVTLHFLNGSKLSSPDPR